jgi:hypothetical protein
MLSALAQKELKELMRQSTVALQPKAKPVMAARNVAPKREVRYSRHAKEALREYKMQLNGWVPSQDGEEATAAEFIALGRCFQLTEGAETPANAAESVERFHGCDPDGILVEFDPTVLQPPSELMAEDVRFEEESENMEGSLEAAADSTKGFGSQIGTLQERVKALETEASIAGQLSQRIKELELQLEQASHAQVAARQEAAQWEREAEMEQAARRQTEAETATVRREIQHMQGVLAEWEQWGANAQSVVQSLFTEVEGLRPLKA